MSGVLFDSQLHITWNIRFPSSGPQFIKRQVPAIRVTKLWQVRQAIELNWFLAWSHMHSSSICIRNLRSRWTCCDMRSVMLLCIQAPLTFHREKGCRRRQVLKSQSCWDEVEAWVDFPAHSSSSPLLTNPEISLFSESLHGTTLLLWRDQGNIKQHHGFRWSWGRTTKSHR